MRLIDADLLMEFIRDEAAERLAHFKATDGELTVAEDTGFIEGLEVVALYVERVKQRAAA